MKKLIIVTLVIMTASCATMPRRQSLPTENQDALILATLWYQKSAEMRALYYQCFRNAKVALAENLALHESSKPAAVVLDIDETVLDNSPFQGWQVINNRPFNSDDWTQWVNHASARPLPGALEFTRYADSLGVAVIWVSNRTDEEMPPTIENMALLGFPGSERTHMYFKSETSSKVERRAVIEEEYEIILLIGDNLADHSGLYESRGNDYGRADVDAERHLFGTRYIVLPNPMYGHWLNELLRNAPGSNEREKLINLLDSF